MNSSRKAENRNPDDFFNEIAGLQTEKKNPESSQIDTASPLEIARIMNREDQSVAKAVGRRLDEIAAGIEIISTAFRNNGRLFYAGSGTSGRLGILDASECPPTFGTPPEMVQGLIAGGPDAVFQAQEGAEDSPEAGAEAVRSAGITSADVVCGLTASGRTPWVAGALKEASQTGAATILICCVERERLRPDISSCARIIIDVPAGPEIIAGSTRLKSGTAQKMVCNMLTTGAMIRLGKVYQNVMVDLQLTNRKLHERARRIIMEMGNTSYNDAGRLLENAGNHVKTALVMAIGSVDADQAEALLKRHEGFIRPALEQLETENKPG